MNDSLFVELTQVPQSVEAFVAVRDGIAATPEGGAAAFVLALILYTQDEPLGRACLITAVDHDRLQPDQGGYHGWQLRGTDRQLLQTQLRGQPHIPRSYVVGAVPENGYTLPPPPYQIQLSRNIYSGEESSGRVKLFVHCSGAASPRPITLQRNQHGLWKAQEWSSLLSGVVKPAAAAADLL